MKKPSQEPDRELLEAVSDDYQSFESVVSKVSCSKHTICAASDIERSLLTSIANNLVRAYLIHADPPYATAVGANSDTVQRYWFWITEQGREYLRGLVEKQAIPYRRRLN
jgi:hypothetical protein